MRLTRDQVQTILKNPINQANLHYAVRQEERLVFHGEQVQDRAQLNQAYRRWLSWVFGIIPEDKYARFESLITTPVPTNKQIQSIFTELRKVFESQNGSKRVQFIDPSLNQDYQAYTRRSKITDFASTRLWEAIKTQICSFVVIDLPQIQITQKPEPYAIIVPVANVHDCRYNDAERLDYLIFKTDLSNNMVKFTVLDDEFYRTYVLNAQTGDYDITFESAHSTFDSNGIVIDGPGYVPAEGVWKVASKASRRIEKIGPITNVLGDLDWYLFKEISAKYFGLYGDYPIIFTYKTDCDYKNEQGAMCEGGRVERTEGENTVYDLCPDCESRKRLGAGSIATVDAPKDDTDVDLMKKPIHISEVSTELLQYGQDYLDDLEDDIFMTSVGQDTQPTTMAQNEKQVQKSVESREGVLNRVASSLEVTEKFIIDTCCYLRYGRRLYIGSQINYGTKHYLQSAEELDARYQAAKTAGKPMYELQEIRDVANKTENRSNPEQLMRNEILQQLEPWADLSIAQIQSLTLNAADTVNFTLKVNFNSYIQRFERENMNIVEFGSMMDMAKKINIINLKLQDYARQTITEASPQPDPTGGQGAAK